MSCTDALIADLARVSCEEVYDDVAFDEQESLPELPTFTGTDTDAAQRLRAVREALAERYGDAELYDALGPVVAFLESKAA